MTVLLERLQENARALALEHVARRVSGKDDLALVLDDLARKIESIGRYTKNQVELTPGSAERWLVDHADFLLTQCREAQEALGDRASKQWRLRDGSPRAAALAATYWERTEGRLDADLWVEFVSAYEDIAPLTLEELWLLPVYLRASLLVHLNSLSSRVIALCDARSEVAALLGDANRRGRALSAETVRAVLEEAGYSLPLPGPMIVQLIAQLRETADDPAQLRHWLSCQIETSSIPLDRIVSYEHQVQAHLEIHVGQAVSSLKQLTRTSWRPLFSRMCRVEQELRLEACGSITHLDEGSLNHLCKQVARMAAALGVMEPLVASQAVTLANTAFGEYEKGERSEQEPLPRPCFCAYYLVDPIGIRRLKQAQKACIKTRPAPLLGLSRHAKKGFAAGHFLTLAIYTTLFTWFALSGFRSTDTWRDLLTTVLLLVPASEWSAMTTHWLVSCTRVKQPVLRADYSGAVPASATTLVVIPAVLSSPAEARDLVGRLELHHLATRDPHVHYALLGDFDESETATQPGDEETVAAAREAILDLQSRYQGDGLRPTGSTFHFLHRPRQYNPGEGQWLGWERKRGKLVELVELITGQTPEGGFCDVVGDLEALRNARYIITLDADTQLPVGAAQRMIGGMDYGYNRARLNHEGTRVVDGYGILQPRIGIKHEAVTRSWLGRLWAGEPGIDPYAFAVSDPYQDAFGEGIFTGKGIFDVHAFATTLCQRIPDNRVLSHDLLEGGFLRAGLLADVELIDDHPATFAAFQMRLHRWVRGDWQLLMWLLPRVADRRGRLTPVDLSTLTRFQMLDNLRRSLLTPWLLLLTVFGLCGQDGEPLRLSVMVFATLALPLLRHCASVSRLWHRPGQTLHVLGQVIVTAALLPFSSALMLDAIVRTLWRLGVSRKHLLEWAHSARVDRQYSGRQRPRLVFARLGYALLALTALAILTTGTTGEHTAGILICVFWAFAPAYARLLDRPVLASAPRLSDRDHAHMRDIAKQIWGFYETYAAEADHYLPPDNVQVEGDIGPAHRTSPTNIGLLLAATVVARDFAFIDATGMLERLDRTVGTVERLTMWNGHLYNWYDTQSLEPLPPLYVSTVDSGNLVTAMMTVRSALQGMANDENAEADERQRAHDLALRLDALVVATDFRPLYDEGAKLFALGFHVAIGKRDAILYDLMASEARQASFVAIALGQVPVTHWFALGRATRSVGGVPTMMSWSGTMFEYFMPALFLRTYRDTLWDQSYRGALRRQIDYGHTCSLPWGISESGYFAFDYALNYQYRAFGVPGLGFAPGLADDLVLAPYACLLAFRFAPNEVLTNLARLESLGARGDYGFYEALDFTPARMPRGASHKVIRSFMAHHQGMSLLALANGLFDNVMVERFHSDPRVAVTELLLQERQAFASGRQRPLSSGRSELASHTLHPQAPAREFDLDTLAQPEACLLSNGSWTTLVTPDGRGFCKQGALLVTRTRFDSPAQSSGPVLYLRDVQSGRVWSPTYAPCEVATERLRVHFATDHARFTQTTSGLDCTLDICVAPEHDADLRRLTLTNTGTREQRIEVTSYQELALAIAQADLAHPAFAKLFIETSVESVNGCLVARRRPRSPGEEARYAAHNLIVEGCDFTHRQFTTDRASFIGRGRDLRQPRGLSCSLGSEIGAVIDPAFIIRHTIVIPPGSEVKLFSVLATGRSREHVLEIVRHYDSDSEFARALQLAWTRSQIELRHEHLTEAEAGVWQTLAGLAMQGGARIDERRQRAIAVTERGQTTLWSHGISGDVPLIAATICDTADLAFVNRVARGHEYIRRLGLAIDLVLLCDGAGGYRQELYDAVKRSFLPDQLGGPGGAHVLRTEQMPAEDVNLLIALAVASFSADGPSLKTQLRERVQPVRQPGGAAATARVVLAKEACEQSPATDASVSDVSRSAPSERSDFVAQPAPEGWEQYNGWGGFSNNGSEYRITLSDRRNLPAPWTNVLANPQFGCIITELGTGYTWWRNSRECKLTPWRNDPVVDDPGEMCFIRDIDTGAIWSPTPAPIREPEAYEVTHGRGWTRFLHESHELQQKTIVTVSLHEPVKVVRITLTNHSSLTRHLSVTYMAQWALGVQRDASSALIVSAWDAAHRTLIANNHYQTAFRDAHAFLHMNAWTQLTEPVALDVSFTTDEQEVYGALGSSDRPQGLAKPNLSGSTIPCVRPCAAISGGFTLAPGAAVDVCVLVGCEASTQAALDLVERLNDYAAVTALHTEVTDFWQTTLSQIEVQTQSPEFDLLLNGWLVYQALACRMWARTAFYQAGGAYGFRDQLQDAISLLHTRPDLTRAQILLHARHQFLEGDVQHWWHEETARGIRTRYSDDLLWLPYAVARYVEHTGDRAILAEEMTWLIDKPLAEGEEERYGETVPTKETGTLYEHCQRAIARGLCVGQHGIPLIGGGDWNDGLNLVGPQGHGESVWLGWFLCDLLQRFAAIARIQDDPTWVELCEQNAGALAEANEASAWDGQWYRRAYTDAGQWLGSISDRECKIDAIAQSFSVMSGLADQDRAQQAMHSFARELVDSELGIARLLKPPFDQTDPSPGYIQGYPPGIRENGGQYTHGVIWSVIAWCILKDGNRAFDLFHLLSPVSHTGTPRDVARYAGEPYVMAADVCGSEPHAGRAGWTWYTGAAGWMYQAGVEWLLGLRRRGERLVLDPCLPDHWEQVRVRYRFGQSVFDIIMQHATRDKGGELTLEVDGTPLCRDDDGLLGFPLVDDGNTHAVLLTTSAERPEYAEAIKT